MQTKNDQPIHLQDVIIGILGTIAIILITILFVANAKPNAALADGMTVAAGDFVLTVGQVDIADEEYIYLLDVPAGLLIAYRFNPTRKEIEIVQGIDIGEIRKRANEATSNRSQGRTGRGSRP